ncbi:MAG: FtsH protease activity modulator HflK [Planctomycetes bacterium]|nr:FtsH protease activity modulator HflK [Planctomycetota bacterium]
MELLQQRRGGGDLSPKQVARGALIIFGTLLVAMLALTSYYTVAPEEEAVVLRFGKYHETRPPGLHFKLPFGIDQAIKVPVTEVRKVEFGFRTKQAGRKTVYEKGRDEPLMLTGDLNIAAVEWVVQYRIKDAKNWLFKVREQEETIIDIGESVMRAVVGDHTVTEVLGSQRVQIAERAREGLQERLDKYEMGVHIVTVQLQNANPPKEVQASFNDVNGAEQERSQSENEALRDLNQVIQFARGDAKRVVSEAQGYAIDRVNRARGDVARFVQILKVYRDAKEVTRRRLYLEVMEKVLPNVERILVVGDEGVLKMLPLGEGGVR